MSFSRPAVKPHSPFAAVRRAGLRLLALSLCTGVGASAQTAALHSGVSFSRAQPELSLGLTLRNLALIGGFGLSARLMGDLGPDSGLEVSGLLDWPLDDLVPRLTAYGGPGVALNLGHAARLRPSLLIGLNYDLDGQASLYGEGSYRWSQFRVRAGVTYLF